MFIKSQNLQLSIMVYTDVGLVSVIIRNRYYHGYLLGLASKLILTVLFGPMLPLYTNWFKNPFKSDRNLSFLMEYFYYAGNRTFIHP